MTVGVFEVGVVVLGIVALLWLLPDRLPQLGRAIRQFREELKSK